MENFARSVIDWYDQGHRAFPWRETKDPYRIWISEIMLQQTRAETVISYYNRFMDLFPDIETLASSDEQVLFKAWEGLGYYSRARNLQRCAKLVCEKYGGKLPDNYDALLTLPGIGPYTAGAVASIAFGRRCAAVDGNVLRVMARFKGIREDIRQTETVRVIREMTTELLPDTDCDRFSNAMMELGACICTPKHPKCPQCPVAVMCEAYQKGLQETLPVRSKDREKRIEQRDILLLYADNRVFIMRQCQGLLEGLYTFPNLPGWTDGEAYIDVLREKGLEAVYLGQAGEAKHVFTHIVWEMRIHEFRVARISGEEGLWVTSEELESYPMATAIQKARQICRVRLPVSADRT